MTGGDGTRARATSDRTDCAACAGSPCPPLPGCPLRPGGRSFMPSASTHPGRTASTPPRHHAEGERGHRGTRLRGHRRAKGGDDLVVRRHLRTPRRLLPPPTSTRNATSSAGTPTRPFGPAECSLYHDWFPRPAGPSDGRMDPRLHPPSVGSRAPRSGRSSGPAACTSARPRRALPLGARPPTPRPRKAARWRRIRTRSPEASTTTHCAGGSTHFPPEQILVLQYERCVADPAGQLARTYRFLGLEPFIPEGIGKPGQRRLRSSLDLDEDVRRGSSSCTRLMCSLSPRASRTST